MNIKKIIIITVAFSFILFVLLQVSKNVLFYQNDDWIFYDNVERFFNGNFELNPLTAPLFYTQGIIGMFFAKLFGLSQLPVLTVIISIATIYVFYLLIKSNEVYKYRERILLTVFLLLNPFFIYSAIGFMTEIYFVFFVVLSIYLFEKKVLIDKKSDRISNIYSFKKCRALGKFKDRSLDYIRNGKNQDINMDCNSEVVQENKNIEDVKLLGFRTKSILIDLLSVFFVVGAFFVRQLAIVVPISFGIALLLDRRYKKSALYFILSSSLLIIYFFFFPKTPEMIEKPVNITNIYNFEYLILLLSIILVYLSAFTLLPFSLLISHKLKLSFSRIGFKKFAIAFGFVSVIVIAIITVIKNTSLFFNNFPYILNVFTRKGLFTSFSGNKYHFIGFYDLFNIWEVFSIFVLLISLLFLIFYAKNIYARTIETKSNHYIFIIIIYFLMLVISPGIYDRYLLPIFVIAFLLLTRLIKNDYSKKLAFIGISIYLLFLFLLGYQYTSEFIISNKIIWRDSVNESKTYENKYIYGTHAWNKMYQVKKDESFIIYTYDNPDKFDNKSYILDEIFNVNFPLSIYIDAKIYKYRIIQ